MLKLRDNNYRPLKGICPMEVRELRDALAVFNQSMPVEVAVPEVNKPHHARAMVSVGHLSHDKPQTDHTVHAVDLVCDHWDTPGGAAKKVETVADLVKALAPFPDPMHVRVAMPLEHDDISHRLLDVVSVGRLVGTPSAGPVVQVITESWDYPSWVIREKPERAAARIAEYERVATSVPPGEAAPAGE